MPSTLLAAAAAQIHELHILAFLKDARYSIRLIEVSLFGEGIFDLTRTTMRRWEPEGDLVNAAREISKYIIESGCAEVKILATDEV